MLPKHLGPQTGVLFPIDRHLIKVSPGWAQEFMHPDQFPMVPVGTECGQWETMAPAWNRQDAWSIATMLNAHLSFKYLFAKVASLQKANARQGSAQSPQRCERRHQPDADHFDGIATREPHSSPLSLPAATTGNTPSPQRAGVPGQPVLPNCQASAAAKGRNPQLLPAGSAPTDIRDQQSIRRRMTFHSLLPKGRSGNLHSLHSHWRERQYPECIP